jgi:hypothetical protein
MARFAEDSDRLAELVGKGFTMPEACARASISYKTARHWLDKGGSDPDGVYGAWARRVDAVAASSEEDEPGAVEREVEALIAGHELRSESRLACEQAKVLARKIDQLDQSPGAAAAQAMAHCSRRVRARLAP